MKTFSAYEFQRNPRAVYRAIDLGETVRINHNQYPDKIFIITSEPRGLAIQPKGHKDDD